MLTRKDSILWGASVTERYCACSASDRQGANFEFCVWRAVSSHLSHHPQEVLLTQFNPYVHKYGRKLAINWLVCKRIHCYTSHINFKSSSSVIVRCCLLYYAVHYALAVTDLIYPEQTMYFKNKYEKVLFVLIISLAKS